MIQIKNKFEIEYMKISGEIIANIFLIIKEIAKPGITTIEIDNMVEKYIKKNNGIPSFKGYKVKGVPPFPASVCASVNEEVVHGIPDKRVLIEGDIVGIDVGVFKNGFHADACRTFTIGKVTDEVQRLVNVTKSSFYNGIVKAVPGNRILDISTAIEETAHADGFSVVQEFVGHGIGKELHEEPQIPNYKTKLQGPRLEAGMTLAIEPMINQGTYGVELANNKWTVITKDRKLSSHYENTILVTEGEPIILTKI